MRYELQPLRIPSGWTVEYNDLAEVDPTDVAEEDLYSWLKEDLLQLTHTALGILLDVGWYPAGFADGGAYSIALFKGSFGRTPVTTYRTRIRAELVAEIERLLLVAPQL